jgi:hypothetical protein
MNKIWIAIACLLGLVTPAVNAQEPRRLQGFSVVMILGEAQGSVPSQGLSAPAQKALADIRDFLPYKGYRVLDTQWVAGSDFGISKGLIRGIDRTDYEFLLHAFPNEIPSKPGQQPGPLSRAKFELFAPAKFGADTNVHNSGFSTKILDTSFAIKTGETVVVGTSRVQGESALIVLVTAVPVK